MTNSPRFYRISNSNGGQDSEHNWWRHKLPASPPPIKYTSSCREDQRLSSKDKIFSKYSNISLTLGRSSINPPHLPLYHGGGYDFPCTSKRQNIASEHKDWNKVKTKVLQCRTKYTLTKAGKLRTRKIKGEKMDRKRRREGGRRREAKRWSHSYFFILAIVLGRPKKDGQRLF